MCQPRRRKSTSAQEQVEATEDVERIAREWCQTAYRILYGAEAESTYWEQLHPELREDTRRVIEDLLHRGVIRPGQRPRVDPPLEGQTTIDEHLEAP